MKDCPLLVQDFQTRRIPSFTDARFNELCGPGPPTRCQSIQPGTDKPVSDRGLSSPTQVQSRDRSEVLRRLQARAVMCPVFLCIGMGLRSTASVLSERRPNRSAKVYSDGLTPRLRSACRIGSNLEFECMLCSQEARFTILPRVEHATFDHPPMICLVHIATT